MTMNEQFDTETQAKRKKFYNSAAWSKIRQQVLERDNYECQMCKAEGRVTTQANARLDVDHIEELEQRPDLALELDNLRVLCAACHDKRHNRFQRRGSYKPNSKWQDEKW